MLPLTVVGRQLGHYVVLTQLGSGGMGEVYVAQDTRLDRRVALKLPRREVSASVDRLALFRREARAAAALNHPNIVHLYSVEEADGLIFITMELVQGRSLRELLSDGAPLALSRTLAFASQIAEGLASAHAAGVLHRDLKPGNVMITEDDRVKILDFGVAKFFRPDSIWDPEGVTMARELSSSGTTVGTVGYMSPEQALGKTLDARTDLFALGVVLFEMSTGKAPFEGDTPAMVFDHLLNRQPCSPLMLNPVLPTLLATILDRALEKDPERRYRSANDFLEDLTRLRSSHLRATRFGGQAAGSTSALRATADKPAGQAATAVRVATEGRMPSSIVVLPFVDMSPRQDQEYFCHGITEEIINTLTRVPGLRVISRTSAFAFHGKSLEVTEIGRRLRVGTALEGSVRKAADRVRVTAQLVNAEDGYQLWSRRFDCDLSDVFAIQDEIAATIVSEFQMGLAGHSPGKRASFDVTAHDAYLKGMYARNKWTDDSMRRAIVDFREAITQDSGFAPAYVALAEAHLWLYSGLGVLPANETVPQARWAVEKALELDPTLADAHKVRALIAMDHDWDRKGAEEALTRALQLGPGSAAAHLWNAWRLALLERQHDQALIELDEAERLDPLDLQLKTQLGYVHYFHHDLDRAIAQFEKVLALEPSFAFAHYALGDACTQIGQYDRAFREFNQAIELGGRSVNTIGVLGYAYGRAGNRDRAKEHLQELTARAAHSYVSAMWIALVHLGLQDHESLFHWLDRAFEERDGSLILITAAVEFDPVREDQRFKSLLGRMSLGHLASSHV
jgi:TolB-like protein/Tfp pilus assembly protein PilF/predicted Ser/Thr protein kinase